MVPALLVFCAVLSLGSAPLSQGSRPTVETALAIDSTASAADRSAALSAVQRLLSALQQAGGVTCFDLQGAGTDQIPGCAPGTYVPGLFPEDTRTYSGVSLTLAEASAILRRNEAVRDSVISRECRNQPQSNQCGGAVNAAAIAVVDAAQRDTEAKLEALRSLVASTRGVVALVTPGLPFREEPRALKSLISDLQARRVRLVLVRVKSPTDFKGLLSDAAHLLASRSERATQVDLTSEDDVNLALGLITPVPPAESKAAELTPAARGDEDASVLQAVHAYVERFAREMRFVIAQERYDQEVRSRLGSFGANQGVVRGSRSTEAEVSFAHAADGLWIMARRVVTVDGQPVGAVAASPLAGARTEREAMEQLARVANDAVRWNIGSVHRNINSPTLAIWLLTAPVAGRFRFTVAGTERTAYGPCHVVRFTETHKPPLMQVEHDPTPAKGRVWVVADSGAVVKTELVLERYAPNFRGSTPISTASVTVDYTYWPQAKLWVPATMVERYEQPANRDAEIVVAKAVYSRYQQFTIGTRIK